MSFAGSMPDARVLRFDSDAQIRLRRGEGVLDSEAVTGDSLLGRALYGAAAFAMRSVGCVKLETGSNGLGRGWIREVG